uniref:Ribosomal protein S13 n=1 Tax=Physarum polycephalum TaxID=5791 RepID=F2Y9U7_PHYPO|nr:ribosomal protein S13 [Physarum polycephalum]
MIDTSYLSLQPRQSCVASFQIFYGIGKIKATRLNSFLLNHPVQTRFTFNFKEVIYPSTGLDIWKKIPKDMKIRLCVENHLRNKILTYCYQMYRLFQNLPTKGQRTKANANAIYNLNPYKALQVNIVFYHALEVAYKKRELLNNERYDELKAFEEAQAQKEKMKKEDQKQKSRRSRQEFIKHQRLKS